MTKFEWMLIFTFYTMFTMLNHFFGLEHAIAFGLTGIMGAMVALTGDK